MGKNRISDLLGAFFFAFPSLLGAAETNHGLDAQELEFFEKKIRPVLAESCYECHNSSGKMKGDIALDWKDALIKSDVIVPGKPEESALILAISHAENFEAMPDKAPKLSALTIRQFEEWIRMGAPDPRVTKPTKEDLESQVDWPTVRDKRAEWWSFQPLRRTKLPRSTDDEWNTHEIDRYIATRIEAEGLKLQPLADPATLVRRLHLILTGLPPSPEVVQAFVADPSEGAYVAMVDRLLSSPRFGERWARHWMDWYRFAESHGSEGDPAVPYARVYRDYLIRALNDDVPYDQLIREHLAGDLLPMPRINEDLNINESAIGPAQFRMVPHGFGVTNAYEEQVTFTDNQVDVISKATLGLTVSCARCHNHKFDPISQKDFYRFYGVMVSSRPTVRNIDSPSRQETNRVEIEKSKSKIRKALAEYWLSEMESTVRRIDESRLEKLPDHDPFSAWVDASKLPADKLQRLLGVHAKAHHSRLAHNKQAQEQATFHLKFSDPDSAAKWFATGNGTKNAVRPAGGFALAAEGENAITGIYPAGLYSHLISDKHGASLNTVFHRAKGKQNVVRGVGVGSSARFAVRSYTLSQGLHPSPKFRDEMSWIRIGKYDYWNGELGYHQISTGPDNTFRQSSGRSWFGVTEILSGEIVPKETGAPLFSWYAKMEGIKDRDDLLRAYRDGLRNAIEGWRDDSLDDEYAILLDSALRHGILIQTVSSFPETLQNLVNHHRRLESEIPTPRRVAGVMDAEIWDQPLLVRGDTKEESDPVKRRFLEVFPGQDYPEDASGRLELAEDILREENPLASRVIVNRLWHHIFGNGLVSSTDNFGRLGAEPSHPELLDYLSLSIRSSGWSLKQSIREMVTSRTFRTVGTSSEVSQDKDPSNRLLSYYPPRRLEAEAIHDTLQFVADAKVGKRVIYKPVIRNRLDPFLTTFNFPVPTTSVGARDLTNVPGQALTLLNGPMANRSAERWARRITSDSGLNTHQKKIARMYEEAYSRPPSADERNASLKFIIQGTDQPENKTEGIVPRDAWRRFAHALINTKEFIYVR
ncbi:MAG: PSD1 and planctomycete cytochrome C domain-containing protein [Akkermansiaceae bacterium]